ncbi:alanine--tRNA ligase [Patescibacteria group bacterium]|nr:alanine--tRNA ligase [Patescibacteria group bacterium]
MQSEEIRQRFLKFFEKRGHKIIPSASLVPENDPSALFISAGMQPLVPYLLGEKHPLGTRLVDVQKCVRTTDIDDVGDATHATFFEMLGNWSLGDYFKEDAIKWSHELLISKKEGFGLDPRRLYITVFAGDENAPADEESEKIWQSVGIPKNRIYRLGADKNWWQAGESGPCGPDSEMYYDVTKRGLGDLTREQFLAADDKREVVEIWNDVFMEYLKKDGKVVGKLPKKNVDTGAGLERLAAVLQNKDNIFYTDLFAPVMEILNEISPRGDLRAKRIAADHIRSAVFILADGVTPSNTDRGYVLRRLIRRAVRFGRGLGLSDEFYKEIISVIADKYGKNHSHILQNVRMIEKEFLAEADKFSKTLDRGMKEFEKGTDPFVLFTSYGFPIELTLELAREKDVKIDLEKFNAEMKEHQELSRAGAEQKFKGGLADTSDKVTQYHTATHLLHQALRDVLGEHVGQKGSNITAERLRFDFTHHKKMTPEEISAVEKIVNEKIKAALPVNKVILPRAEAEKTGARHFFGEKYGDQVSVYYIGETLPSAYSKEFCGGPHVANTSELKGVFKITKEEAVAAGIRRIKAVLA